MNPSSQSPNATPDHQYGLGIVSSPTPASITHFSQMSAFLATSDVKTGSNPQATAESSETFRALKSERGLNYAAEPQAAAGVGARGTNVALGGVAAGVAGLGAETASGPGQRFGQSVGAVEGTATRSVINPAVYSEAELFTDGEITASVLADVASMRGLPLYVEVAWMPRHAREIAVEELASARVGLLTIQNIVKMAQHEAADINARHYAADHYLRAYMAGRLAKVGVYLAKAVQRLWDAEAALVVLKPGRGIAA